MKKIFKKLLWTNVGKNLVGMAFSKWHFLLPIKKLKETPLWMAFVHPEPCYPIHIVIVPKREINDWLSLPVEDAALYAEFVSMTQSMIREFCLIDTGYRFIVNGGINQTFPFFHVHLVAGEPIS